MDPNELVLCRVCGSTEGLEMIRNDRKEILMFNFVMSCKIKCDETHPLYFCVQCIFTLVEIYEFKSLYQRTYEKFKSISLSNLQKEKFLDEISKESKASKKVREIILCDPKVEDRIEYIKNEEGELQSDNISQSNIVVKTEYNEFETQEKDHYLHRNANVEDDDSDSDVKIEKENPIEENDSEVSDDQNLGEGTSSQKESSKISTLMLYHSLKKSLPNPEIYTCEKCGESFENPWSFKNHSASHLRSRKNADKSEIRSKSFFRPLPSSSHKTIETNSDAYKCEICKMSFSEAISLKTHNAVRHVFSGVFKCEACNKVYTHLRSLNNHKALHGNPDVYKCDICHKIFQQPSNLKTHKALHVSSESLHKCGVCRKSFVELDLLNIHKLSCKLRCELCGQSFTRYRALKVHQTLHVYPDAYKCDLCNKTYRTPRALSSHKDSHINPDLFKCDICNKSFTSLWYLKGHKALHVNPDKFKCDVCTKSFTGPDVLKEHKALHAYPKNFKCDVCNQSFKQHRSLVKHKCFKKSN